MAIHEDLKKAIPKAMKARDGARLRTLRSLVTAMTNEVVARKRKPDEFLTDDEALVVLKRAASQRKDSIEQFTHGGRLELVVPEKEELAIIAGYLPTQMSREAVEAAVKAKLVELGLSSKTGTGRAIGAVMKDLKDRADGAIVKEVVDSLLA